MPTHYDLRGNLETRLSDCYYYLRRLIETRCSDCRGNKQVGWMMDGPSLKGKEMVVTNKKRGAANKVSNPKQKVAKPLKKEEVVIQVEDISEEDDNSDDNDSDSDDDEEGEIILKESDPTATATEEEEEEEESSSSSSSLITIVLDLASLETVKTKKGDFQLLNCDDHMGLLRKFKKNPADARPDIIHQELMAVLDSPLNKAGKVKVLVRTEKNVIFEISNKTRIPRTFKRFSGLMVQLLHRLKIRSADGKDMLLKVVKNPLTRHLPAGAKCIGFSHAGKLVSPTAWAQKMPKDKPIILIFGAQASRGISMESHPYIEEMVSISEYPLSGVVAINRVLGSLEAVHRIV